VRSDIEKGPIFSFLPQVFLFQLTSLFIPDHNRLILRFFTAA